MSKQITSKLHNNIAFANWDTRHAGAYSAPQQWAAEDEVAELLAAIIYIVKPDLVLETGTSYGHTALVMARALDRNGFGHLHTIEKNNNRIPAARTALKDKGLPVTLYHRSWENVVFPADHQFHVAFFDATRQHRDLEYMHFRQWIPTGAIVAFHDTGYGRAGDDTIPKAAEVSVQKLIARGLLAPIRFRCPRGLIIAEVVG